MVSSLNIEPAPSASLSSCTPLREPVVGGRLIARNLRHFARDREHFLLDRDIELLGIDPRGEQIDRHLVFGAAHVDGGKDSQRQRANATRPGH